MNDVIKKNNNIFHYVNYLNEENHFKPIISSENNASLSSLNERVAGSRSAGSHGVVRDNASLSRSAGSHGVVRDKDFKYVKPKETIKVQKNQNKKGVQRG